MDLSNIEQEQADALMNTSSLKEQLTDLGNASSEGWLNPLDVYIELKLISTIVDDAMNKVKDLAIDEASKYDKEFEYKNAKVAIRNSAGRWDYSNVQQVSSLSERLKSMQKLAQQAAAEAKHGNAVYDSDGMEVTPAIFNEGKTNIVVQLKK